jgi:hypothetical protein
MLETSATHRIVHGRQNVSARCRRGDHGSVVIVRTWEIALEENKAPWQVDDVSALSPSESILERCNLIGI